MTDSQPAAFTDDESTVTQFTNGDAEIYLTNKRIFTEKTTQSNQAKDSTSTRFYDTIQTVSTAHVGDEKPDSFDIVMSIFLMLAGVVGGGIVATEAPVVGFTILFMLGTIGVFVLLFALDTEDGHTTLKIYFKDDSVWKYEFPEDSDAPQKLDTVLTRLRADHQT